MDGVRSVRMDGVGSMLVRWSGVDGMDGVGPVCEW